MKKNRLFKSYREYVDLQVRKVRNHNHARKGGLKWEMKVQTNSKPLCVKEAQAFMPPNQTRSVLVLGARWGADVIFLQQGGYNHCKIIAIDLYDPPLNDLVQTGDAHDLSFVEEVDLVWAYHVFEHFYSPSSVILELKKVMRNGGIVYVTGAVDQKPDGFDPYDAQDEYSTAEEFIRLFEDRGFHTEKHTKRNSAKQMCFVFRFVGKVEKDG